MLTWLWNLIPQDWKFSVAVKKVTWTVAKTAVALISGTKIGKEVSPENWLVVTNITATLLAGGMKFVHDWAKVKFPNAKWL